MVEVNKFQRVLLEDLVILCFGAVFFFLGLFTQFFVGEVHAVLLLVGVCLLALSAFDVCRLLRKLNYFASIKDLSLDKRGLGWVLIVGFGLTLPMCALVYFVLDYPFELIAEQMAGIYTLTGVMSYAWMATHVIISYLLSIVLIYAIIWVIVNSRSPQTYY